MTTDRVIFFFGSGYAFLAGVLALLAALVVAGSAAGRWRRGISDLAAFLGAILVALSAVPLPNWFYAAWSISLFTWIIVVRRARTSVMVKRVARAASILLCLVALALELPYWVEPAVGFAGEAPTLFVLGDSVSAGMGENEATTWPRLLATRHRILVEDFARVGATTASATRQAERMGDRGGIAVIEIGGNDLLGEASAADFERNLDRLLALVCRPSRRVLLFELPLPPFANAFGMAQRRLARKYGVALVPKRVFVAVLTAPGATFDSVHLTQFGHQRMAESVWRIVRAAFAETSSPPPSPD